MSVGVFKKTDRDGPRPTWYFQARTKSGWSKRSTEIPIRNRRLAIQVALMWETLAAEHRAWDVLDRVLNRTLPIGRLYDLWEPANRRKHDLPYLRRALADRSAREQMSEFLLQYAGTVKPDIFERTERYLRKLVSADSTLQVSDLTSEFLARQFAKLTVAMDGTTVYSANTKRVMHSAWSTYCAWLVKPQRLLERNPMDDVDNPPAGQSRAVFYELDVVMSIVAAQPTVARKAFLALIYGAALEPSAAIALTRNDVFPLERDVRAAGTKEHTRDRQSLLADWAWPLLWALAKTVSPGKKLFGETTQSTMTHWHRDTVVALALSPLLPLYNGRHHWAATRVRAGVPIEVVSRQLGHSSTQETLRVYGKFRPSGADRRAAEKSVNAYEVKRRRALEQLLHSEDLVPALVPA
jgi:integrase